MFSKSSECKKSYSIAILPNSESDKHSIFSASICMEYYSITFDIEKFIDEKCYPGFEVRENAGILTILISEPDSDTGQLLREFCAILTRYNKFTSRESEEVSQAYESYLRSNELNQYMRR